MDRDGFVVVPGLLRPRLDELRSLYGRVHPDPIAGFHATTFSRDHEHRRLVHEGILDLCRPALASVLRDVRIWCGSFIAKAPDASSRLNLHQDMTLFDESRFAGINAWTPLCDLDETNGAFHLLPRSHRLVPTLRGASIPDAYAPLRAEILARLRPCYLRAGDTIIFDQSLLHASPPNRSRSIRPVVNLLLSHRDATMQIAYLDPTDPDRRIELLDEPDDFMLVYDQFGHDADRRPALGRTSGWVDDYTYPTFTEDLLADRYGLVLAGADPIEIEHEP